MTRTTTLLKNVFCGACTALVFCQPAYSDDDGWDHSLAVYLWGADIDGTTTTGEGISVSFDDILDNLEVAGMAAYQARKGKWSILGDVIYMDVEASERRDFEPPLGGGIDATAGVEGLVINFGAGYKLYDDNEGTVTDFVFGARHLDLSGNLLLELDVVIPEIDPEVSLDLSNDVWDAIAGFRGRIQIGQRWFMPWVANVGAGESDFTWAAMAGVGFQAADWADIVLSYRYMKWEFDDKDKLSDIAFSGPVLGAVFRF